MLFGGYLSGVYGINKRNKYSLQLKAHIMGEYYSNYYGLIFNCPFESELQNCSLKKMRQQTAKDRLNYYNALTANERDMMIKHHHHCLLSREKKSLFHESQ